MSGASIGAVSDIAQKTLTLRAKPRRPSGPVIKEPARRAYGACVRPPIAMSLALGTATSGCSLSYKLNSFLGKDSDKPH